MDEKMRVFKCLECGEVFEGKTKRAHDSKQCPFCGEVAVEALDSVSMKDIKYVITKALELCKATKIDNLHRYLEYALEAGVSKRNEVEKFLAEVNNIDAALLFIKHLERK